MVLQRCPSCQDICDHSECQRLNIRVFWYRATKVHLPSISLTVSLLTQWDSVRSLEDYHRVEAESLTPVSYATCVVQCGPTCVTLCLTKSFNMCHTVSNCVGQSHPTHVGRHCWVIWSNMCLTKRLCPTQYDPIWHVSDHFVRHCMHCVTHVGRLYMTHVT